MANKDGHRDAPSDYDDPAYGSLRDGELRLAMQRKDAGRNGDPVPPMGGAFNGQRLKKHGYGK